MKIKSIRTGEEVGRLGYEEIPDLKPCRFCGNDSMELMCGDDYHYASYVLCPRCRARGPQSMEILIAVRLWNETKKTKR